MFMLGLWADFFATDADGFADCDADAYPVQSSVPCL